MARLKAVQRHRPWLRMPPESLPEECLGGRYVPRATEMRFYGFAELINGAVQIHPARDFVGHSKGNNSMAECSEGEKPCPTRRSRIPGLRKEPAGRLSRPRNPWRPRAGGAGRQSAK